MKLLLFAILSVIITLASSQTECEPSITTASGSKAPKKICKNKLIFHEKFDKLDMNIWEHENTLAGGGNWEFQWYTNNRSNSFVKDGVLNIRPTLTSGDFGEAFITSGVLDVHGGTRFEECTNPKWWGCQRTGNPTNIVNPIKSARLRSINSFAFKYGKMEVRAKIPTGDWLWPAIWLMPKINVYSTWPASGEIDLMESRGNAQLRQPDGVHVGVEQVGHTLHYGPYFDDRQMTGFVKNSAGGQGYNQDFHKYQLEWTPDKITFKIDNVVTGEVAPPEGGFWEMGKFNEIRGIDNPWESGTKMAPFDEEFYIILNLAVGGVNYFADNLVNQLGPKPWHNQSPAAARDFWNGRHYWLPTWKLEENRSAEASLQVDYVKVWAL